MIGHTLKNRREIINRRELQDALEAVLTEGLSDLKRRNKWLALYRKALDDGYAEVERRFNRDHDGALAVTGNAYVIDQLVRVIHDMATKHLYPVANPTRAELLSIVAVGGYGRGELAPKSDIDLLFLHDYKINARLEQLIEDILYTLWDLGLKVGHATRSVDECIRASKGDMTIRTAILEMRWVWGEKTLYSELLNRFEKEVIAGTESEFLEAKLAERDERHVRMGDSRYVLEPNIKDGKGGLRDLHTLYWVAKYLYRVTNIAELVPMGILTAKEADHFARAQVFLWTLRCQLHYLTKRAEERLTFDIQPELAKALGYTDHAGASGTERFMKHYFLVAKEVGNLTRIFCNAFEAEQGKKPLSRLRSAIFRKQVEGFRVEGQRLTTLAENQFTRTPTDMLRIFAVSQKTGLDIHPQAVQQITRNLRRVGKAVQKSPEANAIFMDILTDRDRSETTLRHMNECGLFGQFLPDFGRVVAQMQYDMYHVYTTDEHTIRAIGILNRIERGELAEDHPLSTQVIQKISSREVLYTAVLLHDIAKGRGGDHSILGAKIAEEICPRLGLSDEQTDTVAWLVLHHLDMSSCAFKRDLDDPKTIRDFVDIVQSPERLRLLLVLTVVDIRAVGPKVWNGWKAALLRDLYYRAEDLMSGGLGTEGRDRRIQAAKDALTAALGDWTAEEIEAHLSRGTAAYLLSVDPATQVRQAYIVRDAEERGLPLAFDARVDPEKSVTEVTVYTADHAGLFSQLAGAMAVCGASIVDAKINTLTNGMALDTFWIQNIEGEAFANPPQLARLSVIVEQVLSGRVRPLQELKKKASSGLPTRTSVFRVAPRVIIDNKASNTHTMVEVNGRDRTGLLYDVTSALTDLSLQISSAKISTYGEMVVDVFYVKDVFGMKIDHEGKLNQIRERLVEALTPPDERAALKQVREERADRAAAKPSAKASAPATEKPSGKTSDKPSPKADKPAKDASAAE